ncbi:unnamed protein product [Bemisia tabaci]|uniref:Non-canonical purine NTP phosphatase/PRRC1 domain-containing protein n=1 Tax=Bemisia tabaci TaxID=7038 RepID=A0A9P0AII0_BEMTA|nr:unnamed protein product [Bemisia tabaci]
MQEESSSGEAGFEFIDKSAPGSPGKPSNTPNVSKSPLLSNVPPPSALPSFVPVTPVVSQPQMFHQSSFNPVFPPSKTEGSPVAQEGPNVDEDANSADNFSTNASNLFGWMKDTVSSKGGTLLSKVAEKAKTSVDSVITTLDPQMKEFLSLAPGNELEIVVASDKEVKISPIREAFQNIVGKVNVRGVSSQPEGVASQPVGFEAASKAVCSRIEKIRKEESFHGPVVAIENFIVEVTPGKWFDVGLVMLNELDKGINLETYTEFTPLPLDIVSVAKDDTPQDYEHLSTGFAVTIGSLMANNLQVSPNEWHYVYTGVSRRDMLLNAGKMIAGLYKNTQF